MDEYIIINKTKFEQSLKQLRQQREVEPDNHTQSYLNGKITICEAVLSQSTPLIPEIDKAYDAGILDKKLSLSFDNPKGRYISNLKLDI
jgi:hypothetical protein